MITANINGQDRRVKLRYIRQEDGRPIGLVGLVKDGDDMFMSYSMCHKNDRNKFTKALARKIVVERLAHPERDHVLKFNIANKINNLGEVNIHTKVYDTIEWFINYELDRAKV